jgi:expansin (peptidoglycan-binding protein)
VLFCFSRYAGRTQYSLIKEIIMIANKQKCKCSHCYRKPSGNNFPNKGRSLPIFIFLQICILLIFHGCADNSNNQQTSSNDIVWDTVDASFYLDDSIHTGEATFYGIAGEGGNCMLPSPAPWDTMAGAMNKTDYRNSEVCGACVIVTGQTGSALIRINDQCPECKVGDIDLTPNAFERIGPKTLGRMPISWHFTPCPVTGNAVVYFSSGSTVWWAGIQVRNHRNPVRSLEVFLDSSGWTDIARKPYNRFETVSMPAAPWVVRIRDVFGAELVDSAVPLLDDSVYELRGQFPVPAKKQ